MISFSCCTRPIQLPDNRAHRPVLSAPEEWDCSIASGLIRTHRLTLHVPEAGTDPLRSNPALMLSHLILHGNISFSDSTHQIVQHMIDNSEVFGFDIARLVTLNAFLCQKNIVCNDIIYVFTDQFINIIPVIYCPCI